MASYQMDAQGISTMYIMEGFPVNKYQPIAMAGTGNFAGVYFSLTRENYRAFLKTKATNNFNELRSKLVAVKVYAELSVKGTELAALQAIQVNACNDMHSSLASITDHGHNWVATRAIAPAMTVLSLDYPIPDEMVLHILLGMSKACRFLYEACSGRTHGDLHGNNVLIDASTRNGHGLPRLVVIDLDQSKPVASFNEAWVDFRLYARLMLSSLTDSRYGSPVEDWDEINAYISNEAHLSSFEGLISAIEARMAEILAGRSPEKLHSELTQVWDMAAGKEAALQLAFCQAGLMG
ncbi:hypothetical protein PMIN06_005301 [Paraphaeosphaeria minitans]|uniref:Protein kinase domain-containing protein n=1 Tax=Paraphaeosphaeria minitans TaxID=565426 RepID=A0A9P6GPA9_9PLEO|nr:hypothetical protein PMIN01_01687 [Paraphaeosphaeria minitans]